MPSDTWTKVRGTMALVMALLVAPIQVWSAETTALAIGTDSMGRAGQQSYKITETRTAGAAGIAVSCGDEEIYVYAVRHLRPYRGMKPFVGMAYSQLANRANKPQPRLLDDVLGNGPPDLVVSDRTPGGFSGGAQAVLTILSLDGTNAVETAPVMLEGEVFYFKDFDGDGCMEIVNTDWEKGFRRFDESGVPLHKHVWRYDRKAGRYRETGTTDPDPPDTWPAYRKAQEATTLPSAP